MAKGAKLRVPDASFASLALVLVVPATILAFYVLPVSRAVLVIFFGSALVLPELVNFDAPLIPPLDKRSVPALTLLVGVLVTARKRIRESGFGSGVDLLLPATILSIVGTTLTNQDVLVYGRTTLPAFKAYDVVSESVRTVLGPLVPFFLGRTLFRDSNDAKDILRAFVFGALAYAPLVLIELRMSPQVHAWIYGYGQLQFAQGVRGEGYRPLVFMTHGLALALFMCAASLAAWTLTKAKVRLFGWSAGAIAGALSVLLALINSLGALVYGVVATPLLWFLRPQTIARLAVVLACATALYPVARATALFPTQELVDLSARVSQDRAESLKFRFDNEDKLLEKAVERPWFGWGGYSRYHIFTEEGRDVSTTDGAWIILFGTYGAFGFITRFGLLLVPIVIAARRLPHVSAENQPLLAGLALTTSLYALDLLPNGMFNEFPMFLSGAVVGLSRGMPEEAKSRLSPEVVLGFLAVLRRMSAGVGGRATRRV